MTDTWRRQVTPLLAVVLDESDCIKVEIRAVSTTVSNVKELKTALDAAVLEAHNRDVTYFERRTGKRG